MPAKRTKEQQAAYMREYRAKKAAAALELNKERDIAMAEEGMVPVTERVIDMTTVPGRIDAAFTIVKQDIEINRLKTKPAFLVAPDEDCVCGHDRHSYHLTGPCTAFIRPKTKCPCPEFMADLGFD